MSRVKALVNSSYGLKPIKWNQADVSRPLAHSTSRLQTQNIPNHVARQAIFYLIFIFLKNNFAFPINGF